MDLANGAQKTGTHLLLRTMRLFDNMVPIYADHGHIKFGTNHDYEHHVEIIRNPRNALLSWCKFKDITFTNKNIIAEMDRMIEGMNDHIGWLTDPNVYVVKFEELLSDPAVIDGIGQFIGKKPVNDHFYDIWGHTHTFTGKLTDCNEHWNTALNNAWKRKGGRKLEIDMGYSDRTKKYMRKLNA